VTATTLLIIDDDASVHDLIDFHLEGAIDNIMHAVSPSQGIQMAIDSVPDMILLDIEMPKMDGFQVCRQLKEEKGTRDIPVLFLTRDNNAFHIAKGLDCGGADYVVKPFNVVELLARVRAALRTKKLIELLKEHARIDALTGLLSRGAFEEGLDAAIADYSRNGRPFGLLVLDLDHFKKINDTYGHGIGDEVLRCTGAALQEATRPYDICVRSGGEEFAVILNQSGADNVTPVANRVLERLRAIEVPAGERIVRVTGSAGLVCVPESVPETDGSDTCNTKQLLKQADEALYEAKNQGRDRLVIRSKTEVAV